MKQAEMIPVRKLENNTQAFEIITIERAMAFSDSEADAAHSHGHYEMIWLSAGSATLRVDLQKQVMEGGQVFWIRPGQVHQFIPEPEAKGYILSFSKIFLDFGENEVDWSCEARPLQLFSGTLPVQIQKNFEADLRDLIRRITNEFENQYAFKTEVLRRYLKLFLIQIIRQTKRNEYSDMQHSGAKLVQGFMGLLEKNYRDKKMVAEYASLLCVTPNYLNENIKRNTGYSAGHLIRQRVALEAKRLCLYSGYCMKEIAYHLGFTDSAHFSKYFKLVTGVNFTDFKKENLTVSIAV
jgi:AraC family transcriptional regulator, transcriptional activator of pobA